MYLCQLLSRRGCKEHPVHHNGNPWTNVRHRARLHSQLEEIATTRSKIFRELEELDEQERAVRRELNSNVLISILPDDVLAMVFEAGALLTQGNKSHFGSLVSHVDQHWRNIALATPRLWNKIYCIKPEEMDYDDSYPKEWLPRHAAFLARSRSFPVDIYISDFMNNDDFSPKFLELIRDHIGHCRRLSITHADSFCLARTLEYLSCQPAPLLSSIELSCHETCDDDFPLYGLVSLFPLGAPHLTTAQIHRIQPLSLPSCLPAFAHITSLQLTSIWVEDSAADYMSLRNSLMCLRTLNHLELQLDSFSTANLQFPMVLPTIRFLHAHKKDECPDDIIHSIHAESLTTLSIDGWNRRTPGLNLFCNESLEFNFPSLEHLILRNISPDAPELRIVARRFPGIERLTCGALESLNPTTSDIYHVITHIATRPGYREDEEENDEGDGNTTTSHKRWPKLHTIAVTASNTPLDAVALYDEISHLQGAGHPIRKLKLPNHLCQMAEAEAMARLRDIIEVDDFSLDWPTPFELM
ncbi:hypothetical protein FIBSPDRAFT_123837 [Athelia psychrophila]|uniref:Uncharacterized protein n=1 Tax=Athelia psychrophila TaxID=1759441 RepID=A0A166CJ59_9AGAM|nr:hypothetical protein FIBSPDRAFT_123837 [Fibularhizoctonia sp. CBS 109695]